ncbi:deleted in azoospermia-like isoform X2 [Notolabrus celidotus]|nr:deleted in azoospermia-like isoform X2 [Notolabrus celidotus]XP_034535512.1 deleted in azoospermia-like isoform X2 [Notolabrus celidotus]XP_034535513.1 deleted in azoospermia-like isoform X2 [Notolabrus celidotus]XP_034535514.1 deleted in azoospermia-like isoform X2 [Notolabrus celidotus]
MSPTLQMSNGFILPEGKLTPHALFVGGINMKVHVNELQNFFARYGSVKEVKIITYRGGISKGYGFVYFDDDVNIQSIIEQTIVFNGQKLKLGPAIMKERSSRSMPSRMICPAPWMNPIQYFYCVCCSPGGACVAQPSPILNGGSPYNQPYSYSNSNYGGVMVPQMPMTYAQNAYAYQAPLQWTAAQRTRPVDQNFADCGVQTRLNVL